MNQRCAGVICSAILLSCVLPARTIGGLGCGTYLNKGREELFLHNKALKRRLVRGLAARTPAATGRTYEALVQAHRQALIESARLSNKDSGNIAIIDDSDGVIARQNDFDLDSKTIRFSPSTANAARYRVQTSGNSFDTAAASGEQLRGLADDDSRQVPLPFEFPFFGKRYRSVYVNSDGNLTFGQTDAASTDRSLGRVTAGPPRIAPLFTDLDPSASGAVRVLSDASHVVVTWDAVPVYSQYGSGATQRFQVRIYADGAIEFAYNGTGSMSGAVVGIAPGNLQGSASLVSFADGSSDEFSAAVLERFTGADAAVDIATVAQKFYATHEDAYDYLVIYNAVGVMAADSAVAYEVTVRNNNRSGYGDEPVDTGVQYGSPTRLQSVINMGSLDNYMGVAGKPLSPTDWVPLRGSTHDTPVTVIGHETGHLFLAFASVRDPNNPSSRPMLNPRNGVHWAFTFDSDASLLEGNRIQDTGEGRDPRFRTSATVEHYSVLDQYLMGFRAADEVYPPTFVVTDPTVSSSALPRAGVTFNGTRRNVGVDDIIEVEGRRTPDSTVAQRHFRFAFILIVPAGQDPTAAQLSQVESYRAAFEPFFAEKTDNRATADATLRGAVQFSARPAAGVIAGATAPASITVAQAVAKPVTFSVTTSSGSITTPASVTIPAGSKSATFTITGARTGVDEIAIEPRDDSSYETVRGKVQVLASTSTLELEIASGDRQTAGSGLLPQPVAVRVFDINRLPYANVRVNARVSAGGSLESANAVTGEDGIASFRWTPATSGTNELIASIPGSTATVKAVALGNPAIAANGVVNAASYSAPLSPGAIATIFGGNLSGGVTEAAQSVPLPYSLSGVQVLVNHAPVPLYYVSDTQVNFVVPSYLAAGPVTIAVSSEAGVSADWKTSLAAANPGIFFDARSGMGAVLVGNTGKTTSELPASTGEVLAIYCTGLGATQPGTRGLDETVVLPEVRIGGQAAKVAYSGIAPGYPGLYQVNIVVPANAGTGAQVMTLHMDGTASNEVKVILQ